MSSLNIPYSWLHAISYDNGKANLPAIVILAEVVSLYRSQGNDIRVSYQDLATRLSLTKRQVRDAIGQLLKIGVIWREFRTIDDPESDHPIPNVMYLGLVLDFEGFNAGNFSMKAQPKTKDGHVYIIEHQGTYKIGIARNAATRIKGIKLPHAVTIIHTFATNNMLFAERQLHQRFDAKRLNGEWFQLDQDDLQWLCAIERLDDEVKK